jgi:hypothetical protein
VDEMAFGRYRVLSSIGEDPTACRPGALITCPRPSGRRQTFIAVSGRVA